MTLLCKVYRSPRRAETYLYVEAAQDTRPVPLELLRQFEPLEVALSLVLEPGRTLARADVDRVMACIREHGYYLQMPPPPGRDVESLLDSHRGNKRPADAQ